MADIPDSSPLNPVVCGCLVLLLHLGHLLVEAGSVRKKNVSCVFTRGLLCLALSTTAFWLCGYALAFSPGSGFQGLSFSHLALHSLPPSSLGHWFLTASLASLPSVIAAGPLAERSHPTSHLVVAPLLAGLVLPLPAHWLWAPEGWLRVQGVRDAGGVLVVHGVGGVLGLVACALVGRRAERLVKPGVVVQGHSTTLVAMGGFFILLGMVGKLVGLCAEEEAGTLATISLLGGAVGALVASFVFRAGGQRMDRRSGTVRCCSVFCNYPVSQALESYDHNLWCYCWYDQCEWSWSTSSTLGSCTRRCSRRWRILSSEGDNGVIVDI